MNREMIYIPGLKMTDEISDYLKSNKVRGNEYKTLKATLIASLYGAVMYKSSMYLYGVNLLDICNDNK